ncbi:MAG: SpoIIE family protein phosphatase [Planctomycetaceae bacterium]|jgi:serine phosphatase RsbU (regulator of sigma subunit)/pSer/pThr/pTyr-binding forkhead associated (FHA) protein|nr:SpoIIE family protein phosphatase [Planctomycetaceae bacterium]
MALLRTRDSSVIAQKTFLLENAVIRIGRAASSDIPLDHHGISREHAIITQNENGYFITDLDSRNGTFINGRLIKEKTPLTDGDLIRLCDLELVFTESEHPSHCTLKQRQHEEQMSRVFVVDTEYSESFTVKSQIKLADKKPAITSANAAVKLQAMIDIGRNLGAAVDQVLPQLVENLLKIFLQADCAYILLLDDQTSRLELKAFLHRDPHNQESFRVSRSILEKVAMTKNAILSDDVANDSRFAPSDSIISYNICSIMAAPIMDYDKSEVLGVIQVDARSHGQKFTPGDLDLLVALSYPAALAYQSAKLHEAAVAEKIIEREMNIANTVQRGLLPQSPPQIKGYGFYDFYRPAKYLGGDYYDYIQLADGKLVFALGDVSGKGVAASLLMAKLSAEVRGGLIIEPTFAGSVSRLNKIFCEARWDNRFITFFFGVLDPKTHEIVFFNAGHIPPILVSPGGVVEMLGEDRIGLPLGVMEDTEYPENRFTIRSDQKLVVLSDGLTDAMDAQEQYFTMRGVVGHLKTAKADTIEEFGEKLINAVHSFAGRTPQTDDQSLLIVGRIADSDQ